MEANELRIGNWLLRNGSPYQIKKGFEIDNTEKLQPIPLTEEWLLKFGFSKPVDTVGGFSRTEKDGIVLLDMRLKPGTRHKRIGYVHELQNLYFALTGEELTLKTK